MTDFQPHDETPHDGTAAVPRLATERGEWLAVRVSEEEQSEILKHLNDELKRQNAEQEGPIFRTKRERNMDILLLQLVFFIALIGIAITYVLSY